MTTNIPDPHKAPIADVARFCATRLESLRQECRHAFFKTTAVTLTLEQCPDCHGDGFCPWPITDLDRWMDAAHEAGWPSTTFELGPGTSGEYTVILRNDWLLKESHGKTRGEALVRTLAWALSWGIVSEDAPSAPA